MIRRFFTALVLAALALVLVAFAVANRQAVTIVLDPFNPDHPALARTLPLYQVMLLALVLGVVVGGCAAWLRQSSWRRRARWSETEIRALRERASPQSNLPARTAPPSRLTIPPSAA